MVAVLLLVCGLVLTAGLLLTLWQAWFGGCLASKVWACCSLGAAVEFIGEVFAAALSGLRG